VFPSREGSRYAFWPVNLFDRARKAAGLAGGPHKLRHTFASHFLATTPDLYLLAQIMGHSHAKVTELYAHLLPDHLARGRAAVSFAPAVGAAEHAAGQRWGGQGSGKVLRGK
jgi:integrase